MEELADESINIVVTSPPYPMVEMWDDIFAMQNKAIACNLADNPSVSFDLMHGQAALNCGRNFVGYEIDKTLEEYHESLSATQIACSRTIASSRILQHNRFVADREINGKDLKYFNKHLGCKVMTKQEKDIKL